MEKQSNQTDIDSLNEMLTLTEQSINYLTLALAEIDPQDKDAYEMVNADLNEQVNIKHSILLNIELINSKQNEPPAEFGN